MQNLTPKQIYGIKSIKINGVDVFTYKIQVKNLERNVQEFANRQLPFRFTSTNKIMSSFTTTNLIEFQQITQKLGFALKAIAEHNLKDKYCWVQDQPKVVNTIPFLEDIF